MICDFVSAGILVGIDTNATATNVILGALGMLEA